MTPHDLPPSFHRSSLEGKVAVVTGSTQGLGEATLRLFKERGCKGLVITGRNEERGKRLANELTSDSCHAIFVEADLENIDEVRNIMKVTDEIFGTLDILVNAAATTERGSLWDTTPADYDRIMNINARAPFFLTQDAARIMEREKVAGSIINISSTASYGSMPMLAAYGMSKGALNVATKNAAYSLMWSKIRVNALAIGWMDTPGEDAIQRRLHSGDKNEGTADHWKQAGEANQPFGRLLQPDEVARCIAFCASDESGMVTGCVIDFDQSVWGAGNAPVPPPKDQWAKTDGMTFSFESRESKATAPSSKFRKVPAPRTTTPKSTPMSTPVPAPKATITMPTRPSTNSPSVTKSTITMPTRPSTNSPSVTKSTITMPTRPSTVSPSVTKSRIKIGSPGNGRWPSKSPPKTAPELPSLSSPLSSPKKSGGDDEKKEDDKPTEASKSARSLIEAPLPSPPVSKQSPKVSSKRSPKQSTKKPKASKQRIPVDEPPLDEERPAVREFRRMRMLQAAGDESRPDDYLPGTDPNAGAHRKKERAQKKYGSGSNTANLPPVSPPQFRTVRKLQDAGENSRPDDYLPGTDPYAVIQRKAPKKYGSGNPDHRATKVDEWLGGSGTNQRRSYKVKGVREIPQNAD